MRLSPKSRPRSARLRLEVLEARDVPAIMPLDTANVAVANTSGTEGGPDIAMKPDGTGFVVAWEASDGNQLGVFFRQYDANWQPIGGAVRANTFTTGIQNHASVGIDASGNFVVTWESQNQVSGTSGFDIFARRFNASGVAIDANEFQVNVTTANDQFDPQVAVNPSGQFAIVWGGGPLFTEDAFVREYASTTGALTTAYGETPVTTGGVGVAKIRVAITGTGATTVAYDEFFNSSPGSGGDGSNFGVFFKQVSAAGVVGSAVPVNTVTAGNQQNPDIAMDGSGNFVIVWQSDNVDGSGTAVVMQRYNSAGVAQGGNTTVNTGITIGSQNTPHVSRTATGDYVVTWTGEESDLDGSGADIYYKKFDTNGNQIIPETLVNTGATAADDVTQDNSVPGVDAVGDFAIVWEDPSGAGPGDIEMRRYGESPTVQFAAASSSGAESSNASIQLTRSGAPYVLANTATAVTVNNAGGGTATPGTDFTTTFPQTVNFPAGSDTANLSIAVVDDTLIEPDETIKLSLGTVTGGTAGAQTTHTYTILDNDSPTISVSSPSVTEGDSGTVTLTFTISLSATSGSAVTGNYVTIDGTATAGSDYVALSSTPFSIAAGSMSTTVNVTVNGDTLFEPNETFQLKLSGLSGTSNATASGTGTITDDDAAATIAIVSGDTQSATTTQNFTNPLVVSVKNAAGNFVQGVPVVFTAPASGASATFSNSTNTITVNTDSSGQASSGTVTANGTVGGPYSVTAQATGGSASTSFSLTNAPPISLSIDDVTKTEGDSGTITYTFTVSLDKPAGPGGVTFDIATADGTATTADSDYVAKSLTSQVIPSGATTYTFDVTVNGDTKNEADETFFVNVMNVTGAAVADGQGQGTITNDDPVPSILIDSPTVVEGDSGTSFLDFNVSLSALSGQVVSVTFNTADGTATVADNDYVATGPISITFLPGATTTSISVPVNGDTNFEPDETVLGVLSSPTNATLAGTGIGTGTITNDDPPPSVTLSLSGSPFSENGGVAMVTATLSAKSTSDVTVNLAFSGTAAPARYTASGMSIVIPAGSLSGSITLTGVNDTLDQNDETVIVDVTTVTGGTESGTQQVTATITDDDLPVAVADSAMTNEDVTLIAASVLGNDNAAPGSTAELVGPGTTNGMLTLNSNGTFTYIPNANFNGTDSFQYQIRNAANEVSAAVTVSLTVTAVNDAPSFATPANVTVNEDSGPFMQSGFATGFDAGPSDEKATQTVLGYVVSNSKHALFSVQPTIAPNGTLTFTPAQDANGTATVTVQVRDSGGTANGGDDLSQPRTFTITVNAIDDPPTFTLAGDQVSPQGGETQTVSNFASFKPGPVTAVDEAGQTATYTVTVIGTAGNLVFRTAPAISPDGTLTYQAEPSAFGTATVQVVVTDSGGAVSGAQTFQITITASSTVLVGVGSGSITVDRNGVPQSAPFIPFPGFDGEIRVASGDVTGDGVPDALYGAGPGAFGGHVKVIDGATGQELFSFFAFEGFAGGVFVALGDVNGDGNDDIVVSADAGSFPHVKVFSGKDGSELASFLAYDGGFQGGVRVATGDINGDGFADIITGSGPGAPAHVKVFSGRDFSVLASFHPYDDFQAGIYVGSGDVNGDGFADIITGSGPGVAPHVKVYSGQNLSQLASFLAFDPGFIGGVRVGSAVVDGRLAVLAAAGPGAQPHIQAFDALTDEILFSILVGDPSFTGGIYPPQ
jgi:hypothetical protein